MEGKQGRKGDTGPPGPLGKVGMYTYVCMCTIVIIAKQIIRMYMHDNCVYIRMYYVGKTGDQGPSGPEKED